jgi:hypothetical protein
VKEERLRQLFATPPAEFVAARDALVKALRSEKREAEAKQVAGLRRPSATVWAVNQLSRRSPRELEAYLSASEKVRQAQVRSEPAESFREALAAQRVALGKLEEAAEACLRGAGIGTGAGVVRAVQATLQAAAAGDEETRERLRGGAMLEELEAPGFDALLALGVKPRKTSTATSTSTATTTPTSTSTSKLTAKELAAAKARAREEARLERERARQIQRLEERARKAEEHARQAEAAAKEARAAAQAARAELDQARGHSN